MFLYSVQSTPEDLFVLFGAKWTRLIRAAARNEGLRTTINGFSDTLQTLESEIGKNFQFELRAGSRFHFFSYEADRVSQSARILFIEKIHYQAGQPRGFNGGLLISLCLPDLLGSSNISLPWVVTFRNQIAR